MRKVKTSQAALEFLITYGWVFIVVIVMIAALYSFGILSPSKLAPSGCRTGQEFGCIDFTVSSGAVKLRLKNNAGSPVIIKSIGIPGCSGNVFSESGDLSLGSGETGDFTVGLCNNLAEQYRNEIEINYSKVSGFDQSSYGNIVSQSASGNISYDYIAAGNNISGSVSAYDFNEGDMYSVSDRALENNGIFYGNTRLLAHLDGNPNDESAYNNDGAINGGADCNAQGITQNGCAFDGTGYISGTLINFQNITSASISLWFKTTTTNGQLMMASVGGYYGIYINRFNTGDVLPFFDGSTGNDNTGYGSNLNDGNWHHVVGTNDGTTTYIYIDGILVNARAETITPSPINSYMIGANYQPPGVPTSFFIGTIDEVGMYSKQLSQQEVQQHYIAKKTKFTDWVAGKYGTAVDLDGMNSYVEVLHETSLDITDKITIEAWINLRELTGDADQNMILNKEGIPYEIAVHDNTGPEEWDPDDPVHTRKTCDKPGDLIPPYNFAWYLGGLSGLPSHNCGWKDGGGPIQKNTWTHLAITYDGSLVKTFVNGVKKKEYPASGTIQTTASNMRIGARSSGGTPPPQSDYGALFNGIIDSVAVYNDALSEQIIAQHAAS